ncbi:MAG: 1,4-dihydroxy-2-naphthoate octaprenyltransferase, partial [Muribaculaceae bacterium]|nr:1,4-dihydroxy-2-naphthoate octaprenyltransferase [Muribaculaceae bacterium]
RWVPAVVCLLFAVGAQIASNFANEYYDYRDGLDRRGRSGPRRGVTEGDIAPQAMKRATYGVLALTSALGLSLVAWGGLWLIAVGIVIAVGALAYSAGPWPLSRHCLGEVMVILFFGIVPVNFTCWLVSGTWSEAALLVSLAIGLMGANVLIINNYRDADDDRAVGKHTLATLLGRKVVRALYLVFAIVACLLAVTASSRFTSAASVYVVGAMSIWWRMRLPQNPSAASLAALNPLLGLTACSMLLFAILLFA